LEEVPEGRRRMLEQEKDFKHRNTELWRTQIILEEEAEVAQWLYYS
jgi:hypothetical protein